MTSPRIVSPRRALRRRLLCGVLLAPLLALAAAARPPADGTAPLPAEGEEWIEGKKGLRHLDVAIGEGEEVRRGSRVAVTYTGWLVEGGERFDTNRDGAALSVQVGAGRVIRGWELGLVGMREGGVRRLLIPAKLAYGRRGVPGRIPGNADLLFEIEVHAVQ